MNSCETPGASLYRPTNLRHFLLGCLKTDLRMPFIYKAGEYTTVPNPANKKAKMRLIIWEVLGTVIRNSRLETRVTMNT
ncbi:MAG TPA: hypothetical protein VFX22_05790, partial [Candidatus Kapabacteria bacterium]|nr:hypothetical protein [Candidatus Kapabacteria bacterium]